ncbi:glycoside hydrolase family 125 protein [Halosquirtibacter xylanolyticus]|uniref:glycoside hydrolase family 125 protein n=1 Tax=Halosquirtibacter xylanolyticus TaxID=3374599 RepID=UPI0037481221|nr:glycoside hydrolase family 125 protein [Prolixibacteraceae bacterium]
MKRRDFIRNSTLLGVGVAAINPLIAKEDVDFISLRPEESDRKFRSGAVDLLIDQMKTKIKDPKLAWLFENCFPNTLDTTVEYREIDGKPDTFVITGDIHAMWLRDSTAQVWPYLPLLNEDDSLRKMVLGLIYRQSECVQIDSYANAFNFDGSKPSHWVSDHTEMKNELHERKWEIDSLCYVVRLAYGYWKRTGDSSVFDHSWYKTAELIYKTFVEQQRKDGPGPYSFTRTTDRQTDTMPGFGWGNPVRPTGLICSAFRPSDDATTYLHLIPSNYFAVASLRQLSEIMRDVYKDKDFVNKCNLLRNEVVGALEAFAVLKHPKYGKIIPFEVDGFGNALFMDDANIPSLLSLPYLGAIDANDKLYVRTRNFVLSEDNPFFWRGVVCEGVGGPHVGLYYVWPMSVIMQALTSSDKDEVASCLRMLCQMDGGKGFMHEGVHKDDASKFTRSWFAWVNTLFGELVIKVSQEYPELLDREYV